MTKNKPPIFIVSGKSPIGASGGGYSAYAHNLSKILMSLGYEVYICALGDENKSEKTDIGTLITVHAGFLNFNITALPGMPLYSFLFANAIRKIANEKNYKKYIVWGIGPWGFTGVLAKKLNPKKVIHVNNYFTTVRHEWGGALKALKISDYGIYLLIKYTAIYYTIVQFLGFLESFIFKSADLVITNYKSTEDIIKKEFSVPASPFKRAHFTVEIYKRKEKSDNTKASIKIPKKFAFYISRHDPRKGINFMLHAMEIIKLQNRKDVKLLIGGKGDVFEANKKLAEKLKLGKSVEFLGFVDDPKIFMKKASVFCFPSIEEGAGALTINEAMSLGCPIVSTACDGINEDIKNGKSGLLVPMSDSQALADGILELWDDPKLAKSLGNAAKKEFKDRFSFEKMKTDIKKLLLSL